MEIRVLITKYKNKIFNIAIIILTLIIVSNIYKSQTKNIESLKETRDTEIKKNEVLTSISQLEKKINIYKSLLSKKDISLVINTIGNIARDSNVKIISVQPQAEENYPAYVRYPFDLVISVDGYHSIGKFVSKIEGYSTDVFFIDKANIKPTEKTKESEQTHKLIVNLTISTVVFKD